MSDKILKFESNEDPYTQTEQYALARRLIAERTDMVLPMSKVADMLDLSIDEYEKLEFGDPSIPVATYENVLEEVIQFKEKNN